uniref:Uncharacterized protein n=1 Tax=Anguilla anguilla TaxID=7936 RepID=A0A0E9P6M9_ANGAN
MKYEKYIYSAHQKYANGRVKFIFFRIYLTLASSSYYVCMQSMRTGSKMTLPH